MAFDPLGTYGANIPFLIAFLAWVFFWKGFSLWHSAKNDQKYWFIAVLIINSAGLLGIIYLFFFRSNRKKIDIFGKPKKRKAKRR